jgi:hypothetical protein
MTMKTKSEAADPGTSKEKKEDLELARKIHLLAQLVRGQLVATHAWAAATARSVPPAALPYQAALPGTFPGGWAIPTAWPGCV